MALKSVVSYTQLASVLADIGADRKRQAYDGFAWFMNVSTSVLIVFTNKLLMDPKKGYGFQYGERVHHGTPLCCITGTTRSH